MFLFTGILVIHFLSLVFHTWLFSRLFSLAALFFFSQRWCHCRVCISLPIFLWRDQCVLYLFPFDVLQHDEKLSAFQTCHTSVRCRWQSWGSYIWTKTGHTDRLLSIPEFRSGEGELNRQNKFSVSCVLFDEKPNACCGGIKLWFQTDGNRWTCFKD